MERSKYLIDSNAVIDYLSKKLPKSGMDFIGSVIDEGSNDSLITKIELLGYNAPEEHYKTLVNFIDD